MTVRMAIVMQSEPGSDAPDAVYVDPHLVVLVSEALRRVTGTVPPYEAFRAAIGEVLVEAHATSVTVEGEVSHG